MDGVLHQIVGVLASRVREAGRVQFRAAAAISVIDLDRAARRAGPVAAVGVACNHRVDVRGVFLVLVSDGSAELCRKVFIRCRQRERHGRCVDFLSLDRAAVFQLSDYNSRSLFCDKKAVHKPVCRTLTWRGLAKTESIIITTGRAGGLCRPPWGLLLAEPIGSSILYRLRGVPCCYLK